MDRTASVVMFNPGYLICRRCFQWYRLIIRAIRSDIKSQEIPDYVHRQSLLTSVTKVHENYLK